MSLAHLCTLTRHADWRVALEQSTPKIQTQIAAAYHSAGQIRPVYAGWCYLTDYYAPAAETNPR